MSEEEKNEESKRQSAFPVMGALGAYISSVVKVGTSRTREPELEQDATDKAALLDGAVRSWIGNQSAAPATESAKDIPLEILWASKKAFGTSRVELVTAENYPELFARAQQAATDIGLNNPKPLYYAKSDVINGRRVQSFDDYNQTSGILVSSAIVDQLSPKGLDFLLRHERGHELQTQLQPEKGTVINEIKRIAEHMSPEEIRRANQQTFEISRQSETFADFTAIQGGGKEGLESMKEGLEGLGAELSERDREILSLTGALQTYVASTLKAATKTFEPELAQEARTRAEQLVDVIGSRIEERNRWQQDLTDSHFSHQTRYERGEKMAGLVDKVTPGCKALAENPHADLSPEVQDAMEELRDMGIQKPCPPAPVKSETKSQDGPER